MAVLTRGRNAGARVRIDQFCNDWFLVELAGSPCVVGPLSLRLDKSEVLRYKKAVAVGDVGFMAARFDLQTNGTFKRRLFTA